VVLEKTLESPLDCKEIQPVHSKGDQPWVFFERKVGKLVWMMGSHGLLSLPLVSKVPNLPRTDSTVPGVPLFCRIETQGVGGEQQYPPCLAL